MKRDYDESEDAFQIRREKTELRRNNVMTLLTMAGVNRIELGYDGSGDSGNVNDPEFFDKEGGAVKHGLADIADILIDLAYAELPGGWEINEGSYGTLRFDLNKRTYEHEHNERIETVETTTDEGEF